MTNNAEPSATSMCVRAPAALPIDSRSAPSNQPSAAATASRTATRASWVQSGRGSTSAFSGSIVFVPLAHRHLWLWPVRTRPAKRSGHRGGPAGLFDGVYDACDLAPPLGQIGEDAFVSRRVADLQGLCPRPFVN